VFGRLASFFTFACRSGPSAQADYLAELIVPFLHLRGWHPDQPAAESAGASSRGPSPYLEEQEILKWIHVGKSNIEIGPSWRSAADGEESCAENSAQAECSEPHAGCRQGAALRILSIERGRVPSNWCPLVPTTILARLDIELLSS